MEIGSFYILTSYMAGEDNVNEMHYGGNSKNEAKRTLKTLRERFDYTHVKASILRLVGEYDNFMARGQGYQNMAGMALPDNSEMKVQ